MSEHVDPAVAIVGAMMNPGVPELPETIPGPTFEFDADFQTKITAMVLRDPTFAQITDSLIQPGYFTDAAEAALVQMGTTYYATYKKAPDVKIWGTLIAEAIKAKRIRKDLVPEIRNKVVEIIACDLSDRAFVADQVSEFAKNQAMEAALYRVASELLPKRDFTTIHKILAEAQNVGISEDAGEYDYFDRIESRTLRRKQLGSGTFKHAGIPSGWPDFDKYLYHKGFGRKELFVFMAPAKGGKSIALWDCAKNASMAGYNVLGITLEVSVDIIGDRIDASLSDTLMRELNSSPMKVDAEVKRIQAKSGHLKLHEFATGTLKPSQIRRLLERYLAKGIKFDMLVVDYADIMAPENRSDVDRENSKSVYIDLRGIAFDYDLACLTATQTNRDGAKATTAKATDVAEDFNKIRIADGVVSINAVDAEKAVGEARLFFAAMRNSEDGFTINIQQDKQRMRFITKVTGRS